MKETLTQMFRKNEMFLLCNVLIGFWLIVIFFISAEMQIPRDLRGGVYKKLEDIKEEIKAEMAESDINVVTHIERQINSLNNRCADREVVDAQIQAMREMRNDK